MRQVGHAGTLDPAAEGVLVVGVGRATKLLSALSTSSKRYAAHIVLGMDSVSGDVEGPAVFGSSKVSQPTIESIGEVLVRFIGEIQQVPPAHAAIKVDGQPLYRRARRGESVVVPSRTVLITALNVLDYQYPDLFVDVHCSVGTYVRSLARDIGEAAGTGGYLHQLLRTQSGRFRLDDAWSLSELERGLCAESFAQYARHPAALSDEFAAHIFSPEAAVAWYHGRPVSRLEQPNYAQVHAFEVGGFWLGVGTRSDEGEVWQPSLVVHA
jgi:tRNA pseudouridine55 synthase